MVYKFSVIIPVHYAVTSDQLVQCFDSIVNQTLHPSELIIVIDGKISDELKTSINNYLSNCIINSFVFENEVSKGPGITRNIGVKNAKHTIVAFMDSDDVCVKNRFELQIPLLFENNYDLVGGQIEELNESLTESISIRSVPLNQSEIINEFKHRNPINNVTVAMKRDLFQALGGYPNLYFGEDYILWLKMAEKDCKFVNLGEVLVKVRTGNDFLNRRFGKKYLKKNILLCRYLSKFPLIGFWYANLRIIKFLFLYLMPKNLQYYFVKKYTRNL